MKVLAWVEAGNLEARQLGRDADVTVIGCTWAFLGGTRAGHHEYITNVNMPE